MTCIPVVGAKGARHEDARMSLYAKGGSEDEGAGKGGKEIVEDQGAGAPIPIPRGGISPFRDPPAIITPGSKFTRPESAGAPLEVILSHSFSYEHFVLQELDKRAEIIVCFYLH